LPAESAAGDKLFFHPGPMGNYGKSVKKKSKRSKPKTRFGIVMTNRVRLFLIGCFLLGFAVISIVILAATL
jgi:hypothetical protein